MEHTPNNLSQDDYCAARRRLIPRAERKVGELGVIFFGLFRREKLILGGSGATIVALAPVSHTRRRRNVKPRGLSGR